MFDPSEYLCEIQTQVYPCGGAMVHVRRGLPRALASACQPKARVCVLLAVPGHSGLELGIVGHAFNPSPWEAEAGGSL